MFSFTRKDGTRQIVHVEPLNMNRMFIRKKQKMNSLNWEDYMVILIALEDHQAVLNNRLSLALGAEEKQIRKNIHDLTPLRRKLHALRDKLDQ